MPAQQLSPPLSPKATPALVLCADAGGSKVCVVIRSADGLEVRGFAGPCNVQSVGHGPAIQNILLATYRALAQLPAHYRPDGLVMPNLDSDSPIPTTTAEATNTKHLLIPKPLAATARSVPVTPFASRPNSPKSQPMPYLSIPLFRYVWLGIAGINHPRDEVSFTPTVIKGLNIEAERLKITNALELQGIKHVAAVVCGTGTVGRTIEVANVPEKATENASSVRQLPLTDVGVSRGWGWLLCDEGSAFWIGRLAGRSLLFAFDRCTRESIYSTPPEPTLSLHRDLLAYFAITDPMELIGIVSLIGPSAADMSIGEATAKRNAYMAGAARTVLRWAFPDDASPPSPPSSENSAEMVTSTAELRADDDIARSRAEAMKIVKKAIAPMVEMAIDLLGDQSVVKPETTVLALGGGLWQSKGYRGLFQEGLRKEGVEFAKVMLVDDAAGVGAKGLASVEFGH